MKVIRVLARTALPALLLAALVSVVFVPAASAQDVDPDREEAVRLIDENKYLEALPILERIILSYPDDAELWAHFGIAIISNSVTLATPEERKEEQERGLKALQRAEQLGTTNERALDLLEQFESADGQDNFVSDNPEVEKALREGEAFFGKGDYENALKLYEKAHSLDPKNYEAVLFIGDCYYAQKKYSEAIPWFAKAVAIDQDREMAHRFWGDALLYSERPEEAREKFVDAVIAEPYGRMGWTSLNRWAEETDSTFGFYEIVPPGNELGGTIEVKESGLSPENGTVHWREYERTLQKLAAAKPAAAESSPRFSDDVAAWKSVAEAFRKDLKGGKIRYPDHNLVNLLRIDDQGLLEAYILLLRPHEHYTEDYIEYRKANRAKIREFIVRYVLMTEK